MAGETVPLPLTSNLPHQGENMWVEISPRGDGDTAGLSSPSTKDNYLSHPHAQHARLPSSGDFSLIAPSFW